MEQDNIFRESITETFENIEMPNKQVLVVLADVNVAYKAMDEKSIEEFASAFYAFKGSEKLYEYNKGLEVFFLKSNNVFNVGTGCKNQLLISKSKYIVLFLDAHTYFPNNVSVSDPYSSQDFFISKGCCTWVNRVSVNEDPILKELQKTKQDELTINAIPFEINVMENIGFTFTLMTNYPFDPYFHKPGPQLAHKRAMKNFECNTQTFKYEELSEVLHGLISAQLLKKNIRNPANLDEIFISGSTTIFFPVWYNQVNDNMSLEIASDPRLMATVQYQLDMPDEELKFTFEELIQTNQIPESFINNETIMPMISMLNCNNEYINYLIQAIKHTKSSMITPQPLNEQLKKVKSLKDIIENFNKIWKL